MVMDAEPSDVHEAFQAETEARRRDASRLPGDRGAEAEAKQLTC